jgi:hypothetical protein
MIFLLRSGFKMTGVFAAAAVAAVAAAAAAVFYKRQQAARLEQIKQQAQQEQQEQQAQQAQQAQHKLNAFENRFLREYDEMADDPEAPVPAAHAHVRDTTPQGDVIMRYDADRAMFCYYCDKRSVQFKYLEPVARKYVMEHGCKRLYIDMRKELANASPATAISATAISATAISATAISATKSVFAQLKKYGKPSSSSSAPAPIPLKEQVTRYWYCGNLAEFNTVAHDSVAHAHDFSIIKPIDYASYKKMNSP